MISEDNPDARLAWLKRLAAAFPGEPRINMNLVWEGAHGAAGVSIDGTGAYAFLHNASQPVSSLEEAADVLRRVFADEIVAVTAFSGGQPVLQCLGPASDPTIGFNVLDQPGGFSMPKVDDVLIETWSGGPQD